MNGEPHREGVTLPGPHRLCCQTGSRCGECLIFLSAEIFCEVVVFHVSFLGFFFDNACPPVTSLIRPLSETCAACNSELASVLSRRPCGHARKPAKVRSFRLLPSRRLPFKRLLKCPEMPEYAHSSRIFCRKRTIGRSILDIYNVVEEQDYSIIHAFRDALSPLVDTCPISERTLCAISMSPVGSVERALRKYYDAVFQKLAINDNGHVHQNDASRGDIVRRRCEGEASFCCTSCANQSNQKAQRQKYAIVERTNPQLDYFSAGTQQQPVLAASNLPAPKQPSMVELCRERNRCLCTPFMVEPDRAYCDTPDSQTLCVTDDRSVVAPERPFPVNARLGGVPESCSNVCVGSKPGVFETYSSRGVVIDGQNVACEYGGSKHRFRAHALNLVLEYYRSRGVKAVAIVPRRRIDTREENNAMLADNPQLLIKLHRSGYCYFSPSGTHDDVFILQFAMQQSYDIVSNDKFREFPVIQEDAHRREKVSKFIQQRRIPFMFVGDIFLPAPDVRRLG